MIYADAVEPVLHWAVGGMLIFLVVLAVRRAFTLRRRR